MPVEREMKTMTVEVRPIRLEDIPAFRNVLDSVARELDHLALVQAPPLDDVRQTIQRNIERGGLHLLPPISPK